MKLIPSVLLFIAIFVSWPGRAETSQEWWKPKGVAYTLTVDRSGGSSVRIPAEAAARTTLPELDVWLSGLSYKNDNSPSLLAAFSAHWASDDAGSQRALVINAKPLPESMRPGSYILMLQLVPRELQKATQTLTLTLTRPAAVLEAKPDGGSSLNLAQIRPFWELSRDYSIDDLPGIVTLSETSGNSGITGLAVVSTRDSMPAIPDDGHVAAVAADPKNQRSDVPARGSVKAKFSPVGAFPLGNSAGKLVFSALELEQPVAVAYLVHSRRHLGWIAVIVIMGIGLGWCVRTWLKGKEDVAKARAAAYSQMATFARPLANVGDKAFHEEAEAMNSRLMQRIASGDAASIASEIKQVDDQFAKLQAQLAKDLNEVQESFRPLHVMLNRQYSLPPEGKKELDQAVDELSKAQRCLDAKDASGAREQLDILNQHGIPALTRELSKWMTELGAYWRGVDQSPRPLSESQRTQLHEFAESVQATTRAASNPADGKLQTVLDAAHDLYIQSNKRSTEVARASADYVMSGLESIKASKLPEAHGLSNALSDAIQAASSDADDPGTALPRVLDETKAINAKFAAAIRKTAATLAEQNEKDEVEKALKANSFEQALELVKKGLPGEGTQLGGSPPVAAGPPETAPTSILPPITHSVAASGGPAPQFTSLQLTSLATSYQAKATRIELVQSVILAALFVMGAYGVYADEWVGTYKEIVAIFVLAFSADITSDGVLALLKKG